MTGFTKVWLFQQYHMSPALFCLLHLSAVVSEVAHLWKSTLCDVTTGNNTSVIPLLGDSTQPVVTICSFLSWCENLKIGTWMGYADLAYFIYLFYLRETHDSFDESLQFFFFFAGLIAEAVCLIQLTCRTNVAWISVSRSHLLKMHLWRFLRNSHYICLTYMNILINMPNGLPVVTEQD